MKDRGALWDGEATSFAVEARLATSVELCLFEDEGETRIPMERDTQGGWRARCPGVGPGALYGYRAEGPWDPERGVRFNPHKLLVDPAARAVRGPCRWHASQEGGFRRPDRTDSAAWAPRSVVTERSEQQWERPATPLGETVIYEAQCKAMTALHPDVPPELRGTYEGLAHPAILEHLRGLGVTALQLLPPAQIWDERHLVQRGKTNAWGYGSLAFFAPDERFARQPGQQVQEFRALARALHAAGIELWVDVVLNHTADGGPDGALVGLRGLCPDWFRGATGETNWTGCGNTLHAGRPDFRRFAVEALTCWVTELGVDGFRFDLAPVLGRQEGPFDPDGGFFRALRNSPAMRGIKLVAEPWDLGPQGYCAGRFPRPWAEWNDGFRDGVRRFWRGHPVRAELATRLGGSQDRFPERGPTASVNFVTCHDGFTLADLVSYEHKHNEANGEANRDGTDNNLSRNWGIEGPTTDPTIRRIRGRVQRSILGTLMLARGVPMLSHGDELGRSQRGNNNAYCQDAPVAWLPWQQADASLLDFARRATDLRRRTGSLRRPAFFMGPDGNGGSDVRWLGRDGAPLTQEQWARPSSCLAMLVEGDLLAIFEGGAAPADWTLPPGAWAVVLDASEERDGRSVEGVITVQPHCLLVLQRQAAVRRS